MNWKLTFFKSLFILIWLWGSLFIWAVIGGIFIALLTSIFPNLGNYPLPLTLYNFGFLGTHLLSVVGLSSFHQEEEKTLPGTT
jgi:predicted permease